MTIKTRRAIFHGGPLDGVERDWDVCAGRWVRTPEGDRYYLAAHEGNTNGEETLHFKFEPPELLAEDGIDI